MKSAREKKAFLHKVGAACAVAALTGGGIFIAANGGLGKSGVTVVNGAGSTAAAPFVNALDSQFNVTHRTSDATYAAIGSSAGLKALAHGAVYAVTDAPVTAAQLKQLESEDNNTPFVQFPMVGEGVSVIFNLTGANGVPITHLTLTPEVLTQIFSGQITQWNSPAIQSLNPTTALPATAIAPFHRLGGSGTAYAFSWYLATNAPSAQALIGTGSTPKFAGQAEDGTPALASAVQNTNGGIGFVETQFAAAGGIPTVATGDAGARTAAYVVMPTQAKTPALESARSTVLEYALSQQSEATAMGYTALSGAQLDSATAQANPEGVATLPAVAPTIKDPALFAGQVAWGCAVTQVTGQTQATLDALNNSSWVRQATGGSYTQCVNTSTPQGPSHDVIVNDATTVNPAAHTGLDPRLAGYFALPGGIAPIPQSATQLRKLSIDATNLANAAVNEVATDPHVGDTKIAEGGAGYVADLADKWMVVNNTGNPLIELMAGSAVPNAAISVVNHALSESGV